MTARPFSPCLCLLVLISTGGGQAADWENPLVHDRGTEPARAQLMPHATAEDALTVNPRASQWAIDLNGPWKFHWSPDDAGRPAGFEAPGFDDGAWATLPVPSNWQILGFGTPVYAGLRQPFKLDAPRVTGQPPDDWTTAGARNPVGCYRRTFQVPAAWKGRQVFLTLDGVDACGTVWLNGEEAGYSQDSRSPAEFHVTRSVRFGEENILAVQVRRFCDGSYLEAQDGWRLSGIYRNVTLWSTPPVHLRDFQVSANLEGAPREAVLDITAQIKNYDQRPSRPGEIRFQLHDGNGRPLAGTQARVAFPLLRPEEEREVKLVAKVARPRLWSDESPHLYTGVFSVFEEGQATEHLATRLGLRTVEVKDGALLLNGQPLKLRGVSWHEHAADSGHAVPAAILRDDLLALKRANVNHLRLASGPPPPQLLDLCDELGILVAAEANVALAEGTDDLSKEDAWKHAYVARAEALVKRCRRHPCVVLWSPGPRGGVGGNVEAAIEAMRAASPGGLTYYEPFGISAASPCEVYAQGDPRPGRLAGMTVRDLARPLYLTDQPVDVGATGGGLFEQWARLRGWKSFAGASAGDWQVRCLWNLRDPDQPVLAFGGGFGEQPHGGAGCLTGFMGPGALPMPAFAELPRAFQPVGLEFVDGGKAVRVSNFSSSTGLDAFQLTVTLIDDGIQAWAGHLENLRLRPGDPPKDLAILIPDIPRASPSAERVVRVEARTRKATPWAEEGHVVAWTEQVAGAGKKARAEVVGEIAVNEGEGKIELTGEGFRLVLDTASARIIRYEHDGQPLIIEGSGPQPSFYRAPHALKDAWASRGWWSVGLDGVTLEAGKPEVSRKAGLVSVAAPIEVRHGKDTLSWSGRFVYHVLPDGTVAMDVSLRPRGASLVLARTGLAWRMPIELRDVTYYGKGPGEAYPNQSAGRHLGRHIFVIPDEPCPYLASSDFGNREEVRWAAITRRDGSGVMIAAAGAEPVRFSALAWTQEQLEKAGHAASLPESTGHEVWLGAKVLGMNTTGAGPEDTSAYHLPRTQPWALRLVLTPMRSGASAGDYPKLARRDTGVLPPPPVRFPGSGGAIDILPPATGSANDGAKPPTPPSPPAPQPAAGGQADRASSKIVVLHDGSKPGALADRRGWKILSVTAEAKNHSGKGGGPAHRMLDGDPATFWSANDHRRGSKLAGEPYEIVIDMGKEEMVHSLIVAGQTNYKLPHGAIREMSVWVSAERKPSWGKADHTITLNGTQQPQRLPLAKPVSGRYLRLVISKLAVARHATISELNVEVALPARIPQGGQPAPTPGAAVPALSAAEITGVTATASSNQPRGYAPASTVDGSGLEGGKHSARQNGQSWISLRSNTTAEHWIQWDLGSPHVLDAIHVWNLNQTKYGDWPKNGINQVDIYLSGAATDPGDPEGAGAARWKLWAKDAKLKQATGRDDDTGFDLETQIGSELPGTPVRWIRFEVDSTFGGHSERDRHTVGLSEIKFLGAPAK